jgi:MoxR-like ATPase
MPDWWIFQGQGDPHDGIARLPAPPPWRTFDGGPVASMDGVSFDGRGRLPGHDAYQSDERTLELVNVALYLRRPLLVTGAPGVGKSTLAYAVAQELRLGPVLRWPITTRSTLKEGLYRYDAIGRMEDASIRRGTGTPDGTASDIARYLGLGPLGTALAPFGQPRVLLVDEVDKSDIDLPNDLLDVFEEGEFEIPELSRIADSVPEVSVRGPDGTLVTVRHGRVRCLEFPFVVLTSNGERDFPPAFLRRCVRLELDAPDADRLGAIVAAHLGEAAAARSGPLIAAFLARRDAGTLATDQLLNAVYLAHQALGERAMTREHLADLVLRQLTTG